MTQLRISLSQQSQRTIEQSARRPRALLDALQRRLQQGLIEVENHLKINYLSAPAGSGAGGSTPVGLRSGNLRRSISHDLDRPPLSGFVGVTQGPASRYAPTILGDQDVTITPKNAKHLWIPIGDNRSKRGGAKTTPREAMQQQNFFIQRSSAGNLIGFNRDPGSGKLRPLFALKKRVTVHGTDALRQAAQDKQQRLATLLQGAIQET